MILKDIAGISGVIGLGNGMIEKLLDFGSEQNLAAVGACREYNP